MSSRVRPGHDVLHLAHHPVARGVDVELGDLRALVAHRERHGAGGRLGLGRPCTRCRWPSRRSCRPSRRFFLVVSAGRQAAPAASAATAPSARSRVDARHAPSGAGFVVRRGRRSRARCGRCGSRKSTRTGTAYATQATTSSTLGCGVTLNMPVSSAEYHASGCEHAADVVREGVQAGQHPGLLEVVDAVLEDAGGHQDQQQPGPEEEPAEVDPQRAPVHHEADRHGGGDAADDRRAAAPPTWWRPARRRRTAAPSRGPRGPPRGTPVTTTAIGPSRIASASFARSSPPI